MDSGFLHQAKGLPWRTAGMWRRIGLDSSAIPALGIGPQQTGPVNT